MAYNERARAIRRCWATTRAGRRCANYAVWADPACRCASHGGRVAVPHVREKTAYPPCPCVAYPFPHRPGSGLCRWPDRPAQRLDMRPGTHAQGRGEIRGMFGPQPSAITIWRRFGAGRPGYPRPHDAGRDPD